MKHETFETQVILKIKTLPSSSSFVFISLPTTPIVCIFIGWLYLIPTVISVTAAMLSKEQGITICGICAIYEIFVAQKVRMQTFFHAHSLSLSAMECTILNQPELSVFSCMQLHMNDIKHLIQSVASGKAPSLATNWWPVEASRRLIVLCLSTLALLFARLHIMGSTLPVFTK